MNTSIECLLYKQIWEAPKQGGAGRCGVFIPSLKVMQSENPAKRREWAWGKGLEVTWTQYFSVGHNFVAETFFIRETFAEWLAPLVWQQMPATPSFIPQFL